MDAIINWFYEWRDLLGLFAVPLGVLFGFAVMYAAAACIEYWRIIRADYYVAITTWPHKHDLAVNDMVKVDTDTGPEYGTVIRIVSPYEYVARLPSLWQP